MAPRKAITEIAPPQPFLCVNRSPIRYGFRGGAKAIRYSLSLVGLMKSSFDVLPRPKCTIFWRGYSASWWCWCYSYPSLFVLIISVISAQGSESRTATTFSMYTSLISLPFLCVVYKRSKSSRRWTWPMNTMLNYWHWTGKNRHIFENVLIIANPAESKL